MQTIAALLLLVATPDATQSVPETPAASGEVSKPVKAKKICRSGASTGSRLTNKTCKTQAEWDALEGDNMGRLRRENGSGF